ncbi:MAG TPA: hypothetical protein VHH15_08870 [Actinophytocola sp.]|nr:hypothetical protein [Actinophytocola sp.]
MLSVSSRELAAALAERLNAVVPAGFVVHPEDAELVVFHDGQQLGISGAPAIIETAEALKEPQESLETAVRAALSAVQDYIAETTTEPWPAPGGTVQPNPDARVSADTVEMWFGDEAAPVLRLPPLSR